MLSHLACSIIFFLWLPLAALTEFGVTYDFSGGRFGDCLMSYLHAKWLAHQKNIPLYYKQFSYSSQLVMHDREKALNDLRSEPRMRVYYGNGVNPNIHLPLLYICPYFPENLWEIANTKRSDGIPWLHFQVDWKDPVFRKSVREMVAPKKQLNLIFPPPEKVSIALHVREGGGFDFDDKYVLWPMKFPRMHFYIDCLKMAIEECRGMPIYCHLFTDAKDPEAIVNEIREVIPLGVPIEFDWRKKNNSHSTHVLEDFFSFFHFDILIRPESNFSLIPSLIHDFALIYSPGVTTKIDGVNVISEIRVERNKEVPR